MPPATLSVPSLIVCNGPDCTFEHLILLARNFIDVLVFFSTFLAVIGFIYAGFKLITSQGNPSALNEAKRIFSMVAIGFAIVLAAWLIVKLIFDVLVESGFVTFGP
jgi:hypothetical protein